MSEGTVGRMGSRRVLLVAAEVGLLAVSLACVLAMGRLFDGGGWFAPIAASAVAAHAAAALLRRRGASLITAVGVMLVGAAVVTTWACYWSTTRFGIPTSDTWSAMHHDLDEAWNLYQDVVAPTPAVRGFVVASCLAIWVIAYIADWAAFRLWVPFEATLPAGTLFLFVALLGEPAGRGWSVALYGGALIGFLLLHRMARQDGSSHWVADRRAAGNRSLLIAGSGLGVLAVVAGSVLWPAVPGARSPGLLDPTAIGGSDRRVEESPLVDIRSRLIDQANVEVFRVQSPVASYWRLTSLEDFDGQRWGLSGSFGRASGDLPESVPVTVEEQEFEQSITIANLAAVWLPSAYEPRAVDIDGTDVRYDEESATLIVDDENRTSDGLTYRVTSRSPRLEPDDLTGTSDEVPTDIRDEYLRLPEDFSPRVRQLAQDTVEGEPTPAAQARALQDYLRTFRYSLTVQPGSSESAIEDFLFVDKVGYCEQFAGAFAAMARSVGIPARVAVGFTPGQLDPDAEDTYIVRGEYAHAWPEVYIAGAGWVPYEPTPGRGIPNAEAYTDVPAQQATAGDGSSSEVAPTTETTEGIPRDTIDTSQDARNPDEDLFSGDAQDEGAPQADSAPVRWVVRPLLTVIPIVLGLALVYALVFPLALGVRRRRRRQAATSPLAQVHLAWTESMEVASIAGFSERPSDTYVERALRLGHAIPEAADAALTLAARLEVGIYSAEGADLDDAAAAWAAASDISGAARAQVSRWDRLRHVFDPRWLLRSWRTERATQQRRITMTARADLEAERELVGSDDRR
ncbi:MAG: transglutaminaseTgpA domain-containing protein [Acidimicrobiales bacterium]